MRKLLDFIAALFYRDRRREPLPPDAPYQKIGESRLWRSGKWTHGSGGR